MNIANDLDFLFFKFGTGAFSTPAAHNAMMKDEVVKRWNWITHEHFLDSVNGASPGLMMAVCIALGVSTLASVGASIMFVLAAIALGAMIVGWLISTSFA